jgi:hypothetical protein
LVLPRPIAGSISIRGRKHRSPGFKNPVKAGCLAAVKTAQEGGEPKPAALDLNYSEASSLSFGGRRMNFPSTGKAIRSALYPLPLLVGHAAPILVKYDFLLLPSRTTKISNAGLLFVVIFSFIYSGLIAGFMRERKPGYFAARQDENAGAKRKERARICGL